MRARLSLLWLCLGTLSCATPAHSVKKVWLPTYLFGAVGGGDLDVRDVCHSGRARELSVGSSWATLGVSFLSLGIYTPREARITCEQR